MHKISLMGEKKEPYSKDSKEPVFNDPVANVSDNPQVLMTGNDPK